MVPQLCTRKNLRVQKPPQSPATPAKIPGTLSLMRPTMELAERVIRGRKAIMLARQQGMDTSQWERYLEELLTRAGYEPAVEEGVEPWMLWEWRRISLPQWRRILQESINQGDSRRETYARWMLRDILLDPEYKEPEA